MPYLNPGICAAPDIAYQAMTQRLIKTIATRLEREGHVPLGSYSMDEADTAQLIEAGCLPLAPYSMLLNPTYVPEVTHYKIDPATLPSGTPRGLWEIVERCRVLDRGRTAGLVAQLNAARHLVLPPLQADAGAEALAARLRDGDFFTFLFHPKQCVQACNAGCFAVFRGLVLGSAVYLLMASREGGYMLIEGVSIQTIRCSLALLELVTRQAQVTFPLECKDAVPAGVQRFLEPRMNFLNDQLEAVVADLLRAVKRRGSKLVLHQVPAGQAAVTPYKGKHGGAFHELLDFIRDGLGRWLLVARAIRDIHGVMPSPPPFLSLHLLPGSTGAERLYALHLMHRQSRHVSFSVFVTGPDTTEVVMHGPLNNGMVCALVRARALPVRYLAVAGERALDPEWEDTSDRKQVIRKCLMCNEDVLQRTAAHVCKEGRAIFCCDACLELGIVEHFSRDPPCDPCRVAWSDRADKRVCGFPGCEVRAADGKQLLACGRCYTVYYCGKAHQSADWARGKHIDVCRRYAHAREAHRAARREELAKDDSHGAAGGQ